MKLIFEPNSEELYFDNYTLEFAPLSYMSETDSNSFLTKYYGNAQSSDFEEVQYFFE